MLQIYLSTFYFIKKENILGARFALLDYPGMITLQKVMATSDGKFVRLCQVGAKVPVEEALAGGQAVNFLDACFSTCKES